MNYTFMSLWNMTMGIICLSAGVTFLSLIGPPVLGSFMAFKHYHDDYYRVDQSVLEKDRLATAPQTCRIYFAHKGQPGYKDIISGYTWCENFPQFKD